MSEIIKSSFNYCFYKPYFYGSLYLLSIPLLIKLYRKLVQLNELRRAIERSNDNNNILSTLSKMIKILYISFISIVFQRVYGTTLLSKNLSYVSFYHNMKWYYVPIISKRGPKKMISKVLDGERDVTDLLTKLAGPNVDFYNNKIKPRDLKMNKIILTIDEEEKIFNEDDEIII